MFTGIISDIGEITAFDQSDHGAIVTVACDYDADSIALGASIACSGVCLTVTRVTRAHGKTHFTADLGAETLACTTLGGWNIGTKINLERALCIGDELGGHLVSGHTDGIGTLTHIARKGESWLLTITLEDALARYVAPKGSVTIDGISLTINEVQGNSFGVCIIAHTWAHTTLAHRNEGDKLNIEVDRLARYAERLLAYIPQ